MTFLFLWLLRQSEGFSELPWGVLDWEIWRSFAALMLHPVQSTTKAQCCPRVTMAALLSMQAAAGVEEGYVACLAFSPFCTASAAQHPSKYIFIKCKR